MRGAENFQPVQAVDQLGVSPDTLGWFFSRPRAINDTMKFLRLQTTLTP